MFIEHCLNALRIRAWLRRRGVGKAKALRMTLVYERIVHPLIYPKRRIA